MRRIKIFKIYIVFWLFIFFLALKNFDIITAFFMSTVSFNIAVLSFMSIGLMIVFKAAYDLVMIAGTFGVIRYKKGKSLEFYLSGINRVFPENIAKTFKNRSESGSLYFTSREVEDVQEWLENKFYHHKVYINFFIGTSLLIGLLGTFTGLMTAIGEMGRIVSSLQGDVNIANVMSRFEGPIAGMSMGFGSSLFGVAAALILSIKGYILNRSQEMLSEDIGDWMNSLVVDTKSSTKGGGVSADSSPISSIIDAFTGKMGEFSHNMEKANKANESIVRILTDSIDGESKASKDQIDALDNIFSALKDINVNQYQGNSTLNDSMQDLSASIMNTNKNIKSLIELQKSNNELMNKLLENFGEKKTKGSQ